MEKKTKSKAVAALRKAMQEAMREVVFDDAFYDAFEASILKELIGAKCTIYCVENPTMMVSVGEGDCIREFEFDEIEIIADPDGDLDEALAKIDRFIKRLQHAVTMIKAGTRWDYRPAGDDAP